ncbi:hypothetical protein Poly41_70540 [Novipirellula artificiosorum]|uniref:Uncharacterized protein n=1 Tax=Novipirellula artificiosorum TaxID=2528016 RepID=A0A5C6CW32_9BACT|nr:hypothetical protein Poly41_70540 [Novipirellula artificiosorum]
MNTVLAVQFRVEFLFSTNPRRVKEHGGTLCAWRNVTKVFNDNHDCRLLINFSFCQLLLPTLNTSITENRGLSR